MKEEGTYRTGIYLRLSREDREMQKKAAADRVESDSIRSQRELCLSWVNRHEELMLYEIYTDDGYSGTSFHRPAFARMMEDVADGLIDCIVVKDLSRFGRDYIEAGRLIQRIFPLYGIRFIAVTDRFDSLTADGNEMSLMLPLKNFVNDSYCRDISDKVKSHLQIRRERGEFVGAFTVYGYCKEETNRNHLVPDPYASRIVRQIFCWKEQGMSSPAIAERLNDRGILPPLEYKKSRGENYHSGFFLRPGSGWSPVAVKRILSDEIYTGTLLQGKREKLSYKLNRYRKKPEEEWSRTEHAHEAVITKEEFDRVRRLMTMPARTSGGQEGTHLFSGFLFCADCLRPMVRRVSRYKGREKVSYICRTRNNMEGCTRHAISEETLKEAVWRSLTLQMELRTDISEMDQRLEKLHPDPEWPILLRQEILRLHRREEACSTLCRALEEDRREGLITEEEFQSIRRICEAQRQGFHEAAKKQERTLAFLSRNSIRADGCLKRFRKKPEPTGLDRGVLLAFLERILVYEDRRICLELRCTD